MSDVLGHQSAADTNSDYNVMAFVIQRMLAEVSTATVVMVKAVHPGGTGPVGTVDVQPMVNQIDGGGKSTPHGAVYGMPYFRVQGGANAVIIDPNVGDLGVAVFASRDISSVKASKGVSNPPSRRAFDMADGIYLGGILNGAPTQYLKIDDSGIALVTPKPITIQASNLTVDAAGNVSAHGEVMGKAGSGSSVTLTGHEHAQAADGHGDAEHPTDPPTAGT